MTKKNTYIAISAVVVVLALLTPFLMRKYSNEPAENYEMDNSSKMVTGSDTETFSGTISAVDTSCFSDGICSVTVDGKKIILVQGGRGLPPDTKVGRLIGVDSVGDLSQRIGSYANVYARLTPTGDYTIYGNNDYYVEVVMISDK
jgi:hypothetical protein